MSTLQTSQRTALPGGDLRGRGRWRRQGAKRASVPSRLVIVGNGMTSYKLCERLIHGGGHRRYSIAIIGEEERPAYDRVHLTRMLTGTAPDPTLLAAREWYEGHGVKLHLGDPVRAIDREHRRVVTAGGEEFAYDRLVLATGSRAYVPPIPGHELEGVHVYRTWEDVARIRQRCSQARQAAVLGGGLLGLEAAQAVHDLGVETWIVERGTSLLARHLDPAAATLLRHQVEKLGLRVHTGREAERIEALGEDRLIQFNTGECLRVQLVIVAAGIRPRDELAAASGLEVGSRGGVKVGDDLRTSDGNIYAVGECAVHRGICYGLAAPGFVMAEVLAHNLLGQRRLFTGSDQSTMLKLRGLEVAAFGDHQAEGETLKWQDPHACRRLVLQNGRLVGATAVGGWPELSRVRERIERQARVWRWERRRFVHTGRMWKGEAAPHISRWPDRAMICQCMGVRRGDLDRAQAAGAATPEQLAARTGASTVCGSCRGLLGEFLGAPPVPAAVPGSRTLAAASVMACGLVVLLATANPLAFAASAASGWRWVDALWRHPTAKRITGFALIGMALLSLLMSARKRWKPFRWGEYGNWRAWHACLGALTLAGLVAHTGFRMGHQLNFVMAFNFLALAAVGGAAGAVTAWERRLSPKTGKGLRSFWTALHVALVWPLPVLILFHVLKAYYF